MWIRFFLRGILTVLLVLILGAGAGCGDGKKSSGKELGEPAYKLTSKELVAEYQKDKKAANAKYAGKVIELTGVVKAAIRDGGPRVEGFSSSALVLEGVTEGL